MLGRIGDAEAALDAALAAAREAGDERRCRAVLGGAPRAALWGPSPVPRASGRCLDVVRILRMGESGGQVEAVALRCQAVLEAMRNLKRFAAAYNHRDRALLRDTFADDYRHEDHRPMMRNVVEGGDAMADSLAAYWAEIDPSDRPTVTTVATAGERVAVSHLAWRGTDTVQEMLTVDLVDADGRTWRDDTFQPSDLAAASAARTRSCASAQRRTCRSSRVARVGRRRRTPLSPRRGR